MQTGHKHNLVKRMRYYHSAIDVDSLLRGNPYDQLKKSYVIFICNFDLCGNGALPLFCRLRKYCPAKFLYHCNINVLFYL
ncbi:MAG: PD-(D/E)XK nuclease family transposase [Candidatus Treponema excrementipullorum]|uniref:PD-(D/E)XK nuclease family transposase n=1 Tax=Candidatus Treponema excrementipullorum TaxID=2838768 RepID=A0A9E2NZ84_9SPIR|nr:PD-(D/E)XK nuclease family transposase [Candidatus Treponema excrementipullorum]